MTKFYSQFQEDEWIVNNLSLPDNGFFIEIGCGADGVLHSNSKYFEDIGWDGFLIEADPSAIEDIQKHRLCPVLNYAVSNKDNEYIDFYIHENKEYSGVLRPSNKKIAIKTISIYSLLKYIGCSRHIDILSVDTEGTELDILDGMKDIKPSILIVEYNTDLIQNNIQGVCDKLLTLNYEIKYATICNIIAEFRKN